MREGENVKQRLRTLAETHPVRGKPLFFAGRKGILDKVTNSVNVLKKENVPGQTFIFQGAPGAGKTALLRRIEEEFGKDRCIRTGDVRDDLSTFSLWNTLAVKLTGLSKDAIQGTKHIGTQGEFQIGPSQIAQFKRGHQKSTTIVTAQITSCMQIAELGEKAVRDPVIMMIDEIQNIKPDSHMSNFVRDLHTQSEVPVLLICAGLSNSRRRLRDAGISRLNDEHVLPIGQLSREESSEAVRGALCAMEAEGARSAKPVSETLTREITEKSNQWPHHITCYIRGVLHTLITQKSAPDFSDMDTDKAFSYGDRFREEYYEARREASDLPVSVIANLYRRINAGALSRAQCAGFIRDQIEALTGSERSLAEADIPDARAALNAATHSGVISLDKSDECEIPIPSMADFIFERERRELDVRGAPEGLGGLER